MTLKKPLLQLLIASFFFAIGYSNDTDVIGNLGRYLQIQNGINEKDVARLRELKSKGESPQLSAEERKKVYRELFELMASIQKSNPPAQIMDNMVNTAVSWVCPDQAAIKPRETLKAGELGAVVKRGKGKIPVILIPDAGLDGSSFDGFMQRNQNQYTMYAITLPGFGTTGYPPSFELRDYGETRLWKNAEQGILNLMKREKLVKPVLIGHQAGAYLAMRTALDHPGLIGKVVVLNGLLYAPMPSASNPIGNRTVAERSQLSKSFLPVELFPRPSQECYNKFLQSYASMYSKDPERGKQIVRSVSQSDAHMVWEYYVELMTTDLTEDLKRLSNPMLVIPSVPDAEMAKMPMMQAAMKQWGEINHPSIRVVPFENSRAMVMDDDAAKLDSVVREFVQ